RGVEARNAAKYRGAHVAHCGTAVAEVRTDEHADVAALRSHGRTGAAAVGAWRGSAGTLAAFDDEQQAAGVHDEHLAALGVDVRRRRRAALTDELAAERTPVRGDRAGKGDARTALGRRRRRRACDRPGARPGPRAR